MKKIQFDAWSPLGWQGFRLRIPESWNPGKITGDFKAGSLRLDDAEVIRMDIEWREAQGSLPISTVVDRFVEGLTKEAQRKKGRLAIQRRFVFGGRGEPPAGGDDQEVVFWEADCRVHALARRCAASNRIVFARVIGKVDENLEAVAREVFAGFEDQPPEAPALWALYDLQCRVPPGYQLESSALRSGHVQLRFSHGASSLQVDRLSMAGILLKGQSLTEWFEGFFRKDLRDLDRTVDSCEVHGHAATRAVGKPRSRWRTLLSPLPLLDVRKRTRLAGLAWHCEESNKIYAVLSFYKRDEDAISIEEVCRAVVCHRTEPPDQPGGDAGLAARSK